MLFVDHEKSDEVASTAKASPPGTVRVVWTSSSAAETFAPTNGVDMANLDYKTDKSSLYKYGVSKAGNFLHSTEFAKKYAGDGIISVSLNPGNLKTELQRNVPSLIKPILNLLAYTPIHGAYTELFAGLSPEVTLDKNGAWIVPWGRYMPLRKDLVAASKTETEGGTGVAAKFWDWSEEQVKAYL